MSEQEAVSKTQRISQKDQYNSLRDGKIVGYVCTQCHKESITPMFRCTCGGDVTTKDFGNLGTVETYTIQRVASEQFINDTPFAWVVVKLDDGPRVTGMLPYVSRPGEVEIGMRLKLVTSFKPGFMFDKV